MDIHYTWIGPPASNRDQDVSGAQRLATLGASKGAKVYFWCLDAHVASYQQDFAAYKNVTVRGVQSFLSTASGIAYRWYYWYQESDDWAVAAMKDIVTWGLQPGTPASYRAFIKDAWSLFLMYTWGGYVLDAGIAPSGDLFNLPTPTAFKAPSLTRDDAIAIRRFQFSRIDGWESQGDVTLSNGVVDAVCAEMQYADPDDGDVELSPQLEVWMLASPRYSKGAWAALKQYCLVWKWMQKNHALVSDRAPNVFRYLIAGCVYNGLTRTQNNTIQPPHGSLWYCNPSGSDVVVSDLSLRKTYHGTSAR